MIYFNDQVRETGLLESVFDIEEMLSNIKKTEDEIKHLKELKSYRNARIDATMSSLEEDVSKAKMIILDTMVKLEPKKKTLPFPGVGKVSRKDKALNWIVEDDESLLADLEKQGLKDKVIEKKEVIVKKQLNSLLDDFEKNKKELPQGVKRSEAGQTLSISFEDGDTGEEGTVKFVKTDTPVPKSTPKSGPVDVLPSSKDLNSLAL